MKRQHEQECQELLGTISDYVDGSLQDQLCRELELHLEGCGDCRVVVDTLRKTVELYHTAGEQDMPAEVRQRLFKRLKLDDLLQPR